MIKITKQKVSAIASSALVVALITSPAIVSAVSTTANTTITATLGSTISMTSSGTVAIGLTPTSGGVVSSASDTVTVSTNSPTGYVLTLADSDATTTLVSGGNTIAAHNGTKTAPTALTGNSWGVAVATGTTGIGTNGFDASYATETNSGSSVSKWAGVPATGSPMMIKTTATTASADTTTVWYGVRATTSQTSGAYADTVTYTATAS